MFWRPKEDTALAELKAARELFEQGKHEEASKTASAAEVHAKTSRTRNAARTTLAWVELDRGYVRRAKAALESGQSRGARPLLLRGRAGRRGQHRARHA